MNNEIWTVVGGGHGGQTFAGHMALLGKRVRLYSKSQTKVDAINKEKQIVLKHSVEGVGKIEFATTDIERAIKGATHIVMILPSNWHEQTTRAMAPYLEDGQFVLILPEASCGAISFRKVLRDMGCEADLVVGAGCTLPYATRCEEPGVCYVCGKKEEVKIAALPASDNEKLEKAFCHAFPVFKICDNVIETSIDNINALMHPAPVLLNVARFEAVPEQTYEYYLDGITPSIGELLEAMDRERIAVAKSLGVKQRTLKQTYIDMYKCGDDSMKLWQLIQNNKGYIGIHNPKSLKERYVLEDVPYSLVAISALGKVAGVNTPAIDAVCTLAKAILGDILEKGRTPENLGIDKMTKNEFLYFILGK